MPDNYSIFIRGKEDGVLYNDYDFNTEKRV